MQGINSIELVANGLRSITLPPLTRPAVEPDEAATEELVKWGAKFYAYSVIAHVRNILESIVQLAQVAGHVPALNLLGRHVFEWAAHACYVSRNLKNYMQRKEWGRAWKLLSAAAIGNLWAKQHGGKYAQPGSQVPAGVPDPLTVSNVVAAYEQYQVKEFGSKDAKDTYGLLSELSHPNSACLQQYHKHSTNGRDVSFGGPDPVSPLPFVNWCLLDLLTFLDLLLELGEDTAVRPIIISLRQELTNRAPAKRT